ncbi:hypothetical protein [Priestia koreensis]|uniref:hypothetical protein n=1 Tax=Priestia koreensis TaxID=284581 RepID=UPI0020411B74|nr:hypothetical protein [Priestia koreensis]MCM3005277.1 hypothetical protein [Priestia koreensis]
MAILFVASLLLIFGVILYFQQQLTIFEMAGCWLVSLLFIHIWLDISGENLQLIQHARTIPLFTAVSISKAFLFPLMVVTFINLAVASGHVWQKVGWSVIGIMTISMCDILHYHLHLFYATGWRIQWTFGIWTFIFCVTLSLQLLFYSLLHKEKQSSL